jgi:O-antigen/teichoic acid export membrane protein
MKLSNRTKAYVKGLTSTTLQKILTKVIGFVVTPIVLSYLGKDTYGIWIVIGSFLGYMGLMDFGITGAVTQLIAKNDHEGNDEVINKIVNNSFFLQIAIGSAIILIGVILSFFFPSWFDIDSNMKQTAATAFLLAAIGYGISFPPKTLKGLIRGRQHIALAVWLEFFLFVLTTGLNLWLLASGFGLLALPVGTIVVRLISYPLFLKMAKKTFPNLRIDIRYFKWSEAKGILKISGVWFVALSSAVVIYTSDTLIIGAFLATALVTVYALTFRLSEFLREFIYMFNTTAMPGLGQLSGRGELQKVKRIFFSMFPFVMSLTFSAVLFLIFFNESFVTLWVGHDYYGGDELNYVFAASLLTTVVFHSFSIILSSGLELKTVAFSRISEAVLNIVLSIWLSKYYGLLGVALGTIVANVTTSFWAVPYKAMRYLEVSLRETWEGFLKKIVLQFVVYTGLFFVLAYMMNHFGAIAAFIVWACVSIIVIVRSGLPADVRKKVFQKVLSEIRSR